MSPLPENIMPLGIARTTSMNSLFKDFYPEQRFYRLQDEEIQDMANDPEHYTKEQVIRRLKAALTDTRLPLLHQATYQTYAGYLIDDDHLSEKILYHAHLLIVELIDIAESYTARGIFHDMNIYIEDLCVSLDKAMRARAVKEANAREIQRRSEQCANRNARIKECVSKLKENVVEKARSLVTRTPPKSQRQPETVWHEKGFFGGWVETINEKDEE